MNRVCNLLDAHGRAVHAANIYSHTRRYSRWTRSTLATRRTTLC